MIKGRINVSKIDKAQLFKGDQGTYLNFVMYENDEPDQYGNHYVIKMDLSQEARQAGEKAKIIGNAKIAGKRPAPKPAPTPPQNSAPLPPDDEGSEVPF